MTAHVFPPLPWLPTDLEQTILDISRMRSGRKMLGRCVEHMIAVLDALDVDTEDLEDAGELEPDLAFEFGRAPHDGELDNSDIEPSLGAAEWQPGGGDPWQHNQGPFGVGLEDDDDAEHEEAGFANPVTGGALVAERQL